jgi:hypothetical protein
MYRIHTTLLVLHTYCPFLDRQCVQLFTTYFMTCQLCHIYIPATRIHTSAHSKMARIVHLRRDMFICKTRDMHTLVMTRCHPSAETNHRHRPRWRPMVAASTPPVESMAAKSFAARGRRPRPCLVRAHEQLRAPKSCETQSANFDGGPCRPSPHAPCYS